MIPRLSPAYLERLAAPTGLGDLEPADRAGEVGSVVGGTGVRVTLRLEKRLFRRRVSGAAFRALGSAAPRAPGSVLVERVTGLDLDAARALSEADLLAPLGDALPDAVRRAATALVEALRRALDDGDASEASASVMAPGVLVCRCIGVGDREIRRAVRRGAETVDAIGLDCAAGTGCHSCWPDLRVLLDETADPPAADEPAGLSSRERVVSNPVDALVRAIVAVVRPIWRAQGITLGEARIETPDGPESVVRLSIAAIGGDALASPIGAVALARHALRETIADSVRVELDPGAPAPTEAARPDARYR